MTLTGNGAASAFIADRGAAPAKPGGQASAQPLSNTSRDLQFDDDGSASGSAPQMDKPRAKADWRGASRALVSREAETRLREQCRPRDHVANRRPVPAGPSHPFASRRIMPVSRGPQRDHVSAVA
jgi:hypothetical protein